MKSVTLIKLPLYFTYPAPLVFVYIHITIETFLKSKFSKKKFILYDMTYKDEISRLNKQIALRKKGDKFKVKVQDL